MIVSLTKKCDSLPLTFRSIPATASPDQSFLKEAASFPHDTSVQNRRTEKWKHYLPFFELKEMAASVTDPIRTKRERCP